jgi:serine/threonine-protein kinase
MKILLTVIGGPHKGREFCFEEHDNFIVGRAKFAHFRLPIRDKFFSRVHFMIEVNAPLCRLLDMRSTNGIFVNGVKLTTADLKDGDVIKAGKTLIRISLHAAEPPTRAEDLGSATTPQPGEGPAPLVGPTPDTYPLSPAAPASLRLRDDAMKHVLTTFNRQTHLCRACGCTFDELSGTRTGLGPRILLCSSCQSRIDDQCQPISGYKLVRELGQGGMGKVHLAVREADGVLLAVKTIIPAYAGSKVQTERFLREARILGQLEHPNIVAFSEIGESGGILYFAMEYVDGTDLARLLSRQRGPFAVPRAVDLICQTLCALEYAHERGFVHRDVKPANLLMEDRGANEIVRLTDFGLARIYQTSPLSGLTLQGSLGGTVAFAAPEQITNFRDAKPPVDQYGAAATLYKLLTDQYIFDLPPALDRQLLMILQVEPISILSRRPEIPAALAEIIHRALARDPGERFSSVATMREALERVRPGL